jgi:sulfur transfer complex TusBCD TusB component (DsrH family)
MGHRNRLTSAAAFIFSMLASAYAPHVLAQEDLQEQFVQRMSQALIELPSNPHELERDLVAKGLSPQDADRTVQTMMTGFVRCLLENLRVYSEEHGESFADKLPHMIESLDEHGPKSVLKDMIIVSRARGPSGEACALNELQKAGIGVDSLE